MSIETERLILRPFTESDAPALLTYLRTPAAHCFQDMKLSSLAEARAAALERSAHPGLTFAITRKDNGRVIGEIFSEPERIGPEQAIPDTYSPCWMLAPLRLHTGSRSRLFRLPFYAERNATHLSLHRGGQSLLPAPERKARHAQGGRFPRVRHLCK